MQQYTLKTLSAVFPSRYYSLAIPRELSHYIEDRLAGKEIFVFDNPLSTDNTFLINNEEPPP